MNWRLLFSGTQSAFWAASVVIVVLLTLGLCLWLSRLERRLVSPMVGRTLLILRLLILCLLLFTLMQPVLTRQWDLERRGRLVIGIDISESMETVDRHATDAEKLRWAQALGMLGNEGTTKLIDQWADALDRGAEPDWLGIGTVAASPNELAMIEGRKKQVAAVLDELSGINRMQFIHRLLLGPAPSVLKQISDVMPVDIRLFATAQRIVPEDQLEQQLQQANPDLFPSGTDAQKLFSSVVAEESGPQIRGIVLLSDGRQTVSADLAAEARQLGRLNVPVYTVPIGSRLPPRDLSLASVDAPETVFLNDQARVVATIGTSGFEGQELTVLLQRNEQIVDRQIVIPAGDSASVQFEIPAEEPGRFDYQVSVTAQPGELRDDNNTREISLQVVDNKARVLLVEGDARWEFRYLKNLLERDEQIELSSVLFRQPQLQLLNESFIQQTLPSADALKQQLSTTDILIIGDVQPQDVDESVWKLIEKAVTEDGLTLLLIPGRRSMPHQFTSDTLTAMLPVESYRQRVAEKFVASDPDREQSAFSLQVTTEAEQLPMFQPEPGVEPGRSAGLGQLTGHPWVYSAAARLSAVVWAFATHPDDASVREPAIVHQYYGFGQVIWMGVDSTWRWRKRAGDTYHHRFWGQLVRWAARNKSAAGNDQVRMTLSDIIVDEGSPVTVSARFSEALQPQLAGCVVEAVVRPINEMGKSLIGSAPGLGTEAGELPADQAAGDKAERVVLLRAAADQPTRFAGLLSGLPAGNWSVQLQVRDGQLKLREPVTSELLVRERLSAELADISCNRELLQQVAQLSGGQLIEPFQMSELAQLIQPQDQSDSRLQEHTLWDHWVTLVMFFALLTVEWVTRKLNGLP